jgi:hypothetical protein
MFSCLRFQGIRPVAVCNLLDAICPRNSAGTKKSRSPGDDAGTTVGPTACDAGDFFASHQSSHTTTRERSGGSTILPDCDKQAMLEGRQKKATAERAQSLDRREFRRDWPGDVSRIPSLTINPGWGGRRSVPPILAGRSPAGNPAATENLRARPERSRPDVGGDDHLHATGGTRTATTASMGRDATVLR